ncbi:ATP-binding protein [Methylomonas methanica]|uniref:histidine kinase n=1 Tax=Methylomonas methanica (strain DSM 25384 / MC09) TaxID=857087 RepID=G0A1N9_METMM|nr:ATP-binding protein [Methylomonas methanica]AEG00100.1 multi-sensor signal transduction histidine kinase [Methylomonas methanica MC09]
MQFVSQLELLRKKFAADLPARFEDIKTLYHTQSLQPESGDPTQLRQALHRLAGLAGTFKAHRISELARNIESRYAQEATDSREENRDIIVILFARLETAIEHYLESVNLHDSNALAKAAISKSDKTVCLIAPETAQTKWISGVLSENGYLIELQANLKAFAESIDNSHKLPSLILMDAALNTPETAQLSIHTLKMNFKDFPPFIFISEHGDTLSRLKAVRAGASDFLVQPLQHEILLSTVAQYLSPVTSQKILIVDDDTIGAEYIANIIRAAGYQSQVLNEPLRIFEALEAFKPDLLILDIFMPECSGIELAKAIRQCCCHNLMPILFLTTGTDIDQELCALGSGGDEFIRKNDPDCYLLEKLSYRLRRIEQIRTLHRQLKTAQQRSERLRKTQSDFLTYVVHELKAPLNLILGFSELLQMDGALNAEQYEMVSEIVKGGHNQLAMIEELSEQVQIATGRFALNIESIDIIPLLNQAVSNAAMLGSDSGISVAGHFNSRDCVYVFADRRRAQQILANLLSNAIKYNKPGGRVWIEIQRRTNEMLRIEVIDTGIGIAPEDVEVVFEAFERLNAAQSGIDGIGIGLSICSQLLKLMNGRIGVDSQLDDGSKFWIELPLSTK